MEIITYLLAVLLAAAAGSAVEATSLHSVRTTLSCRITKTAATRRLSIVVSLLLVVLRSLVRVFPSPTYKSLIAMDGPELPSMRTLPRPSRRMGGKGKSTTSQLQETGKGTVSLIARNASMLESTYLGMTACLGT